MKKVWQQKKRANKSVNCSSTQMDWSDLFFLFHFRPPLLLPVACFIISLQTHCTSCVLSVQSCACRSAWSTGTACVSHNSRFPNTYPWPDYLILQREWEFCPYLWSFSPAPFQLYTADWLSWSMLRSQRVIPAKQSIDTNSSDPRFLTGAKLTSGAHRLMVKTS